MCVVCMQVDAEQFDKIMSYISAGKEAGATLKHGASRHGVQGLQIQGLPAVWSQ